MRSLLSFAHFAKNFQICFRNHLFRVDFQGSFEKGLGLIETAFLHTAEVSRWR